MLQIFIRLFFISIKLVFIAIIMVIGVAPKIAQGEDFRGGTSLDAVIRSLGLNSQSGNAPVIRINDLPAGEKSGPVYQCKPGPWGDLEYSYVYLDAPASLVARFPMPNSVPKWSFPGWTHEQVRALFEKANLPQAFQDKMLAANRILCEEGVLTVFPPVDDLEAMAPAQRGLIYEQLGQYDENEFQKDPVYVTSNDLDDWLKGATLRSSLVDKLRRYLYRRHDVLALSDLSAMLSYMSSDQEARDFQRLMTRTRTLILRLKVNPATDPQKIWEYWGGPNRRNRDTQPILLASFSMEGVTRLDVTHLLPPLAREHLYSYPSVDMALLGRIPDCHWTSLNFFNSNPKDYYLDTRLAADQVRESYDKVSEPYKFGDILMFMDGKTGSAIHSCTYVADDIVFTKNGDNLVTPWLLMKIDEVKRIYFHGAQGLIQGYRLKEPTPNG